YIYLGIITVIHGDAGFCRKEERHIGKQPRETKNILESVRFHIVCGEMNSKKEGWERSKT
ncbi:hypothetical protein ACQP3J_31810, partial [Escherichia coli]